MDWIDVGSAEELSKSAVQQVMVVRARVALTFADGTFGAISGVCNHVGGPLGHGTLDSDYVVCPWHYWTFHRVTGVRQYEDAVPAYDARIENGRVLVSAEPRTQRVRSKHEPHRVGRTPKREDGPIRVLGISTTVMTADQPRYSTSEDLLAKALRHAKDTLHCETTLQAARDLKFRACEGFYSKSARACTWPCSITQMDPTDEMDRIYEAVVHWADVILISTPIRWGTASSLYFKMVERMNCIQNQETIANKHLLHGKVVGFIVTGGQDNIQAVVGQMLTFFSELGCQFPQFPFIAHSRGWSAEDMENNMAYVQNSATLHEGAASLVDRCVQMADRILKGVMPIQPTARGGRKAHELDTHAQLRVIDS